MPPVPLPPPHRRVRPPFPTPALLLPLLALLSLLAACGSDSGAVRPGTPDADGWVAVDEGETSGAWELFAQVGDDGWTGCLRLVHVDGTVERCTEPGSAVVFGTSVASFGAAPSDQELVHPDGSVVDTSDGGLDTGVVFFVVTDPVLDAATSEPLPVVRTADALADVAAAFDGRWVRTGDVDCAAAAVAGGGGTAADLSAIDPAAIDSLELDGGQVVVTSPCASQLGAAPGRFSTCRGAFVLVGQPTSGDEVTALLRSGNVDCDGADATFTELALRLDGDALRLGDGAAFERG